MAQSDGKKSFGGFLFLIAFGWTLWFFFGGEAHGNVVDEAIEQYNIAKRSGTVMEACEHARLVRAAYLQAKDEPNYQKWKDTERTDCRIAGMPDALTP